MTRVQHLPYPLQDIYRINSIRHTKGSTDSRTSMGHVNFMKCSVQGHDYIILYYI